MTNETTSSQPSDMQLELEACREKLREALGTIVTLKHERAQPAAASAKRLTEQQIKELAVKHAYNSTFDVNYGFDPHGLDAFALEIMDNFRAPAAQASATIQAAPDKNQWVDRCSYDAQVDEWAIERSNLEADAATANRKSLEFKRVSDEQRLQIARLEIALQRAATIQEPVMVAEPMTYTVDGEVMSPLEYIGYLHDRLSASRRDVTERQRVSVERALQIGRLEKALARTVATPMVADPAGVATFESVLLAGDRGKINDATIKEAMQAEIDAHRKAANFSALTVAAYRVTSQNTGKARLMKKSMAKVWDRSGYIVTPLYELAATVKAVPSEALDSNDVQWVVNDNAELGVKIGNQFFFLYKGSSLVYAGCKHDNGEPMMWRPVFKREFGECAYPINHADYSKIGTVSLGDSDEWQSIDFSAPLADKPGGGE